MSEACRWRAVAFAGTAIVVRAATPHARSMARPRSKVCQAAATVTPSVVPDGPMVTTICPLGSGRHSRQELIDVADVAVQGFFVACYDAAARAFHLDAADLARLRWQVYDDLARRYAPGPGRGGVLLVARDASRAVVGCIGTEAMWSDGLPVSPETLDSHELRRRRRPVAYVSNLAVAPAARCAGIGRRLVLAAEERAQSSMRLSEVVSMVNAGNAPARRLFESLGYGTIFEDPWATRAVPAAGGQVDRVRVLNIGYARCVPRGGQCSFLQDISAVVHRLAHNMQRRQTPPD